MLNITFNSALKSFKTKMLIIIDRINNIIKNLEIILKLVQKNLMNYNINNINYNILQNINYNYIGHEPILGDIFGDISDIFQDNTYKEFIPKILKIYDKMNKNEIDLIYNKQNNENDIKIFGDDFVSKNKDLCKIIYNNKEYDLTQKIDCKDIKDNRLKIKLKGINNVTDLTSMFEGCSQLSNLSNFSNWNTSYVFNMDKLFNNCKSSELPDISNLNTSNVMIMKDGFAGCSSLKSLPDISNWNTSNVMEMSYMFSGCSSLKSLPDISKWDITLSLKSKTIDPKANGLTGMFDGCSDSLNIPEKFKNVK